MGSQILTHPGERRVVALVGPTGVGKTTTVAKLAAGFRIEARRRVGLLTIDTFRIAAVQQLKAYAEIMDLPMQVVEKPEDMQQALDRLGDVDLVLIDTAGRSPKSDARIDQLVELLRSAQPDETHLVLECDKFCCCNPVWRFKDLLPYVQQQRFSPSWMRLPVRSVHFQHSPAASNTVEYR